MAWTELGRAPARLLSSKTADGGMGPGGPPPGGAGAPAPTTAGSAPPPAAGHLHADPFPSSPVAAPDAPALATRPVYPYPVIARYVGHGDVNDAANYRPAASPVRRPLAFDSWATALIGPDNQKTWRAEGAALVAN
jgi:feruloyl esterase